MSILRHIVRQHLSGEAENVATEALAFLLDSSEGARRGFLKLWRAVGRELPEVEFSTQSGADEGRPDMAGMDGDRALSVSAGAGGVLVVVAPAPRIGSMWSELCRRLDAAGVVHMPMPAAPGIAHVARTALGPALAQLKALCDAAESDGFLPFSSGALSDQQVPRVLLQLGEITQEVVRQGVVGGAMDVSGLTAAAAWERTGRYARLVEPEAGVWLGVHLRLWRDHGATPLWLVFHGSEWGRGVAFRTKVAAWAKATNRPFARVGQRDYAGAMFVPTQSELPQVVAGVLAQIDVVVDVIVGRWPASVPDLADTSTTGG